jgi:CheY-like chemotaxis protein
MATAHNLLAESRWRGADLLSLVNEELAPYAQAGRVSVSGLAVSIAPTVAQNLALALHELATNAAKYGALSVEHGRLQVVWRLGDEDLLLEWIEECPHPVVSPSRSGFGSKVVEASIKAQLGGAIEREWREKGLRCAIRLPSAHFTAWEQAAAAAAREEHKGEIDGASVRERRILIIEDEPMVAMMTSRLVADLGAVVLGPFMAPGEAREAIDPGVDAALLDVNIGGEFIYPLADELMLKGVPIIFVTGYQAAAIDQRFAKFPVLTKPVERNELTLALVRAIQRGAEERVA